MQILRRWLAALVFLSSLGTFAQTREFPRVERLAPGQIRAPEAYALGNLLDAPEPAYPDEAKSQHLAGQVVLKVLIDKEGKVREAVPVKGDPLLSASVVAAVKQWKFRPYILDSQPVTVETTVTAEFALDPPAVHIRKPMPGPIKVRISQGVAEGFLLHKVAPHYPEEAKQNRIQGDVILQVDIDTGGNVVNVKMINGHPLLTEAAMDAIRQWKYRPYLLNGEPVQVQTSILLRFRL